MPFIFNGTEIKKLIYNGTVVSQLLHDGAVLFGAYNITTRLPSSAILASTPSNPSGEVTLAYGTDDQNLYVYTGSTWRIIPSS